MSLAQLPAQSVKEHQTLAQPAHLDCSTQIPVMVPVLLGPSKMEQIAKPAILHALPVLQLQTPVAGAYQARV